MLKKIALVLVVAVAGLVAYASTKPDTYRVVRTASIDAPAKKVWPLVDSLRRQQDWSPWDKRDPNLKRAYSGAEKGKGAVYEWEGNREVGKGRAEIVEAVEPKLVVMDLHFIAPMDGHSEVRLELAEKGGKTDVTWSIGGPMPLPSKIMCLFMDMEKMIGGDFENGLGQLKALAEKKA